MTTKPTQEIEVFPNPYPDREYEIEMECPEFTCLCPKTGQPDFAVLNLTYIPGPLCIELKSLKLYLWSYRDQGAFHEKVVNQILDHLVAACDPVWMQLSGEFNVRGGIRTTITVEYDMEEKDDLPRKPQNKKIN
jgi:7-cyano-7-deazaguanine reductase